MTYKKWWLLMAIPFLMTACGKSDDEGCGFSVPTDKASVQEIATLQGYLTTNGLTATQHPNGFFYNITNAGSGAAPTVCNTVNVKYIGKLLNGTTFDSNSDGASFKLGLLIKGWQLAIPLLKPGGTMQLYLPPTFGYGDQAAGSIPANSYLVFTIELVSVS